MWKDQDLTCKAMDTSSYIIEPKKLQMERLASKFRKYDVPAKFCFQITF